MGIFFTGMGEDGMRWAGAGSGWTSQNDALLRNSTWTWKQVERLREMSSCCDQRSLFISFFYLLRRNDITGQTLSPPRRLQHQCVEFFHNLVLIAVISSGLYLTTSSSNAVTRLISLYLKPWKMHTRAIDASKVIKKKCDIHILCSVIYNYKKIDKYFRESKEQGAWNLNSINLFLKVHVSLLYIYFNAFTNVYVCHRRSVATFKYECWTLSIVFNILRALTSY